MLVRRLRSSSQLSVRVSHLPLFALRTHLWIMIEFNEDSAHTPRSTHSIYFRLNKLWMHERMHVGRRPTANSQFGEQYNFAFDLCSSTVFLSMRSISRTQHLPQSVCCAAIRSCGNLSPSNFSHIYLSLVRPCPMCVAMNFHSSSSSRQRPTNSRGKFMGNCFSLECRERTQWHDVDQTILIYWVATGSQWISLIQ